MALEKKYTIYRVEDDEIRVKVAEHVRSDYVEKIVDLLNLSVDHMLHIRYVYKKEPGVSMSDITIEGKLQACVNRTLIGKEEG